MNDRPEQRGREMKVRCANCRKMFNVKPSARKNGHSRFCSQRCRMIKQNPRRKHFIDKIPLKQYCESNGLNYALIVERMRKKCCSPEEAIKLPYNSHCYHYLTTGEQNLEKLRPADSDLVYRVNLPRKTTGKIEKIHIPDMDEVAESAMYSKELAKRLNQVIDAENELKGAYIDDLVAQADKAERLQKAVDIALFRLENILMDEEIRIRKRCPLATSYLEYDIERIKQLIKVE